MENFLNLPHLLECFSSENHFKISVKKLLMKSAKVILISEKLNFGLHIILVHSDDARSKDRAFFVFLI